jgi:hypothetical protein
LVVGLHRRFGIAAAVPVNPKPPALENDHLPKSVG